MFSPVQHYNQLSPLETEGDKDEKYTKRQKACSHLVYFCQFMYVYMHITLFGVGFCLRLVIVAFPQLFNNLCRLILYTDL